MINFFTSDLHLGHERIIELCNRPFKSVDEMNETIIDRWNDIVLEDDTVYVLGDVALGKIAETLPLIELLNGRKILVPGNHDRCFSGHRKVRPIDVQRYKDVGFIIEGEDIIGPNRWRLCHFPYSGDSYDQDRFINHRPIPHYSHQILLHGHVHEKWKVYGRQVNVGVDVWNFTPVHEDQIKNILGL